MSLPNLSHQHPEASPEREVRLGVELEIPLRPEGVKPFTAVGQPSDDDRYKSIQLGHARGGQMTYERIGDREYGIEARSPSGGVPYYDIADWYEHSVEEIEDKFGREMEPVGFYGDTTAGLHIHLSPLTEEQARSFYHVSQEPWMKVFCGASLANRDHDGGEVCLFPVSRSDGKRGTNYCEDSFDKWHHSCVNKHRKGGVGHYEWRLPEPMGPDHFDLLVEFIVRFLDNENQAVEWAENVVREGDDRLTSVKRAKSIGQPFKHDRPVVTPAANLLESLI